MIGTVYGADGKHEGHEGTKNTKIDRTNEDLLRELRLFVFFVGAVGNVR